MYEFWVNFYLVCEWLLVIAGIAFFASIAYVAVTALNLKNSAMRNAKRLSQPPLNSGKALAATGKGIVMQEKVRVLSIAGQFKAMFDDVKVAATQVGQAAKTIHPDELKDAASNAQNTLRFASTLLHLFRSSPKQAP